MNYIIMQGDITEIACDAIVLPANVNLKEGSGTSRAIFEKAGRKALTQACKEVEYCPVGSVVPTLAFDLDAKYIIHAVVPKWIDGNHDEYEKLTSAYLTALTVADIMECESIAFPLMASGNNGFERSLAFEIAKKSMESFSGSSLKKIVLVVYDAKSVSFVKEYGEDVIKMPEAVQAGKKKHNELIENGKQAAQEGIKAAFKFLNDEKSREKLLKDAKGVYELAKGAYILAKKVKKLFR